MMDVIGLSVILRTSATMSGREPKILVSTSVIPNDIRNTAVFPPLRIPRLAGSLASMYRVSAISCTTRGVVDASAADVRGFGRNALVTDCGSRLM